MSACEKQALAYEIANQPEPTLIEAVEPMLDAKIERLLSAAAAEREALRESGMEERAMLAEHAEQVLREEAAKLVAMTSHGGPSGVGKVK